MTTVGKVIEIYSLADDFMQLFSTELKKILYICISVY